MLKGTGAGQEGNKVWDKEAGELRIRGSVSVSDMLVTSLFSIGESEFQQVRHFALFTVASSPAFTRVPGS